MLIKAMSSSATRWGAALQGARTPQTTLELSGIRLGLSRAQVSGSGLTAIGSVNIPGALRAAGMAGSYGVERAAVAGLAGGTRPFQATNGLPTNDNRKQYVHKTRVIADGGGAPGPEPEREQALQQGRLDPLQAADPLTGSAAKLFRGSVPLTGHNPGPAKREGMAPMQWPDASVSATGATGFEAMPAGFDAIMMIPAQDMLALPVPGGLDLPCTEDPELFFAESPADVETAKALCQGCRARAQCLEGALARREPWGVWGGELLLRGTVVPRKRPRGRPRKDDPGLAAKADDEQAA